MQAVMEWYLGLNGRPALIAQENKGKAWRKGHKRAFYRRKIIIDAVQLTAQKRGITIAAASEWWTALQLRHEDCDTVDKVYKFIAEIKGASKYIRCVI